MLLLLSRRREKEQHERNKDTLITKFSQKLLVISFNNLTFVAINIKQFADLTMIYVFFSVIVNLFDFENY